MIISYFKFKKKPVCSILPTITQGKKKLDEKHVIGINLPEEKKTIEQNILEQINLKCNVKNKKCKCNMINICTV